MPDQNWEEYWDGGNRSFNKKVINFARKYFAAIITFSLGDVKDKEIMEAGSGSCETLVKLSKKTKKVFGLDNSKNSLELGAKNFLKEGISQDKYDLTLCDIEDIPFQDNSMDIVYNWGVIEHFKDPTKPLKEMIRVAKKGGNVFVFVPAKYSLLNLILEFISIIGLKKLRPWEECKVYTKKMMKEELLKAGAKKFKVNQPLSLFGTFISGDIKK